MKKILLVILGLIVCHGFTFADNVTITKDLACTKEDASGYLEVKWPGEDAFNRGYGIYGQSQNKILVYVVVHAINSEVEGKNTLFSYNCSTKITTEITNLDMNYIPIYVNPNSGISAIVLKDLDLGGQYYVVITQGINHTDTPDPIWIQKKINLKDPNSLVGYNEVMQDYIAMIRKEAAFYKDIIISSSDYLYGGSPESIINGTLTTFQQMLSDVTNRTSMRFKPSLIVEDNQVYLKIDYSFYVHKDPLNKSFNQGTTTYLSMPTLTVPIPAIRAPSAPGLGRDHYEYSISTEQIKWLYDNGLTKYQDLLSFNPQTNFTREQAAKFYTQYAINVIKKTPDTTLPCIFDDIDSADSTLKNDIITSCQLGIFKGTKGKFYPKRAINAEEAVAVLIRTISGLEDESHIWYVNYINKAKEQGLLPLHNFTIGSPLSRGVIGQMIYNANK